MKSAVFSVTKTFGFVVSSVVLISLLVACGGGGGGGGSTTTPPPPPGSPGTIPTLSNGEGSISNPIQATLDVPRSSFVGTLTNSYYTFTTTDVGSYIGSLTNPSGSVIWYLYSDASYTTKVGNGCVSTCINNLAANTRYYLKVEDWSGSTVTFTLAVKLVKNEGTTAAPIDLNVGPASYEGSVGLSGFSYYRFRTGTTPSSYTVTLKKNASISAYYPLGKINVFASPFDVTPQVALTGGGGCDSGTTCSFNALAANTYYYVRIDGDAYSGSLYDIVVEKGVSEGALDNRINLVVGGNALNGAVDAYGRSYYQYTATIAGEYILTIGSSSTSVYASPTSSNTACYNGQECRQVYLEPGITYQINVGNPNNSSAATYQIAIAKGATEGTISNPLPLTLNVAHAAAIDVSAGGWAHYKFRTSSFIGSYTIGLSGTQKDLRWDLYTDKASAYRITNCDTVTTAGAGDEICASANLEPNTDYYLSVGNNETTGTSPYSLKVEAGGGSEGTLYTPLQIAGLTHDGSVKAGGYSYYSFTTGASALTYVIGLSNMQTDLKWMLNTYTTGGGTLIDCNTNTSTLPEVCSTQSISGSSYQVLNANTTYYLMVGNANSAIASTFRLTLTPLDPAAGCSAGSTCLGFESGALPTGLTNSTSTSATGSWQWSVDSTNAGSGTKSLKSGSLKWGDDGCVQYTPATKPTSVSFSLKSDSLNNFNLSVYDGTTLIKNFQNWSGNIAWRRVTLPTASLSGASFNFKWCLYNSNNAGNFWIDDIEFQ